MSWFARMPASLSRTCYLNLSNVTRPSSPSHPPSPFSTSVEAEAKCTKLVRNFTSLYILWNEYKFGIGGRQPVKNFSREERMDRYNYYERNIFLRLVAEMA